MRSDSAIAALRDLAHHIDLALSFTAGFDYDAFVGRRAYGLCGDALS